MTTRAPQISALERLNSLPEIFRGSDLTVRFGWTSKAASQYVYLWKKRNLVKALGGHSDVYVNMLRTEHPNWEKAVLMAMPKALVIGIEALRQAGWTTQIPQRPTLATAKWEVVYSTDPYEMIPKDESWFALVRPGMPGGRTTGLPTLRPAWALADLLKDAEWGDMGLWPDDIVADAITPQDEEDWEQACAAFGINHTPLQEICVASR